MTTTPNPGAADLPEALRRSTAADGKTELFNFPGYPLMVRAVDFNRVHAESEMRRAALLDEMQKTALAAGQATAAQAVVQDDLITIRKPTTSAEMLWLLKLAHLVISDVDKTLEETLAPAQPVAEQGAADGFFLLLPQRPKPEAPAGTVGLDWDAYSGAQMLAFGRDCSDAALAAAPQPSPKAQSADSVPAVSDLPPLPEPDLRDVGTKPQEIKEFLKGYATEYARTAIAARAPADSVQEDAALWHWLAEYLVGTRTDLDDEIVASETVNDLRKLVKAAIKQGEKQ